MGSYKMKWKSVVIASSASSTTCDKTIDLMKLKHGHQLGKDRYPVKMLKVDSRSGEDS